MEGYRVDVERKYRCEKEQVVGEMERSHAEEVEKLLTANRKLTERNHAEMEATKSKHAQEISTLKSNHQDEIASLTADFEEKIRQCTAIFEQ